MGLFADGLFKFLTVEYEVSAEVFFAYDGVFGQLFRGALKEYLAFK